MSALTIQNLNMNVDLNDRAFEANKKINFNLKQIDKNVELLPENSRDPKIDNMTELKYLWTVYEIIYKNSKLIGFEYPKMEINVNFAFKTKEKIYEPINKYFLSLSN